MLLELIVKLRRRLASGPEEREVVWEGGEDDA